MKKFIINTIIFVVPFLLLFFINKIFYKQDEGGLVRLGFLYNNPLPKSTIEKSIKSISKKYNLVSELNFDEQNSFTVMTIGDSFSEQDNFGYKNYLANVDNISVLHVDRFLSKKNPVQTLIDLMNGNFFDHINIKYVVLQTVERSFVNRFKSLNYNSIITRDSIKNDIANHIEKKPDYDIKFFSDATIKIPLINLLYNFESKPLDSKTYKIDISNDNLFTGSLSNLLIFTNDINCLKFNNNYNSVKASNKILNQISAKLSNKNITLIVLVSPDKYDLYYDYLKDQNKYPKPQFFNYLNSLPKKYLYVNSIGVLKNSLKTLKNIYYYDDTHWSPIGGQVIAKELEKIINL